MELRGPVVFDLVSIIFDTLRTGKVNTNEVKRLEVRHWNIRQAWSEVRHKIPKLCVDILPTGVEVQRKLHEAYIRVLNSNYRTNKREVQRAICRTLATAREYCYISSPYFLPSKRVQKLMMHAVKRGVDIKVMVGRKSDVWGVTGAASMIYPSLLRNGVRIFEMSGKELHAKFLTSDVGHILGTFNFDQISNRYNCEVSLSVKSPHIREQLRKVFTTNQLYCHEEKIEEFEVKRNIFRRLFNVASYKFINWIWR